MNKHSRIYITPPCILIGWDRDPCGGILYRHQGSGSVDRSHNSIDLHFSMFSMMSLQVF